MKNKFKKSVFLLSSLMMLSVGVGVVNGFNGNTVNVAEAADPTTVTLSTFTATSADMDSVISYTTAKGGGTSNPAINSNVIRLYQNSAGTGGGTITISCKDGYDITSVTIGSSMKTSVAYTLGSETTKSSSNSITAGGTYTYDDSKFDSITFYCMGTDKNSRLYVNYLSVTYEAESTEGKTSYDVNFSASPLEFLESFESSITTNIGEETTFYLPSTSVIENNGTYYAGTVGITGWEVGDSTYDANYKDPITVTSDGTNITVSAVFGQLYSEIDIATAKAIIDEAGTGGTETYKYTVTGQVTAIVGNNVYLQNGSDAILVYDYNNSYTVGANYTVTGSLCLYNGQYEMTDVTSSVTYDGNIDVEIIDITDDYSKVIASNFGEKVVLHDITITSSTTFEESTYKFYVASGYTFDGSDLLNKTGLVVTVEAVIGKYNSQLQFIPTKITYETTALVAPEVSFDDINKAINWTAVENASDYQLHVKDGEGNDVVNETVSSTSYDFTSYANGTYIATVIALGSLNYSNSDKSKECEFTLSQGVSAQIDAVETKSSLGFTYNAETVGQEETVELKYTGETTTNATTEDQASTLGHTDGDLTVYASKGKASNNVGYNKEGTIRLYYNASGSNVITISNNTQIISSVEISYKNNYSNAKVYTDNVDAITGTYSDDELIKTYDVNANTFYITNNNTSNVQVHIYSIKVTYGNATTSYEFSDVRVRFAATIGADVYDSLNIEAAGFEVTADGYSKSMDIDCTEKFATDENGDYFIICSIWQIPEEAYGTVLTAKAYFEVDGVRYYAQETSYSVITLAAAYLENSIYSTLSENAQGAITAFNAQLA